MSTLPPRLNLIHGESVPAASGLTIDVIDPADGQPFTTLPRSDRRDIDAAEHYNMKFMQVGRNNAPYSFFSNP